MKDRHPIVHAWEARPGGEMQANGRRAGEFTLDDALYDSYRFTLSRQIVGEVRGSEVLAMIEAMQSGTGSLSTTHAESAERAVSKLVTCAMKAGPHVTEPYATRAISESLNIVVHVDSRVDRTAWLGEAALDLPDRHPGARGEGEGLLADDGVRVPTRQHLDPGGGRHAGGLPGSRGLRVRPRRLSRREPEGSLMTR